MYNKRTLQAKILRSSKNFKVLLVTGPRQVGKTTLLQNTARRRNYVSLDNPEALLKATEDPEGFLQTYSPPVFIDEVQYEPRLFKYIKMLVDDTDKYGQVWLTGSQQFSMMKNVSESLAGRVAIVRLLGFSIYEREGKGLQSKKYLPTLNPPAKLKRRNVAHTFRIIWQGSFPRAVALKTPDELATFYDSYVQTYIERDVRQLLNVGSEAAFVKFLKVVAARTGQELRLTDIARDVGIVPNTAKNWLSILETAGLIYLLQPYFRNITKRFTKTPKLYFLDTGLAAHLAGWNTPRALETGASAGAFFETFVVSEILKSYYHQGARPTLYYFRDSNQNEIDLLIEQDGLFFPIEIKKTATPRSSDVKAFQTFAKIEKIGFGALICLTNKIQPLGKDVKAISIWDI
ncbi:MAG: ATP-binding protein [Candidatus Margulisbacteria bacterium]|jgi:predicted AAA+ superfamily ATPase|nr:ATP-binding protein [Candidatus Margulisiibacteriota bacterium]